MRQVAAVHRTTLYANDCVSAPSGTRLQLVETAHVVQDDAQRCRRCDCAGSIAPTLGDKPLKKRASRRTKMLEERDQRRCTHVQAL